MDASRRLETLEKTFFREWVRRHPILGASLGLHREYDDKMPDGTLDKELDDQKFLHRMLSDFNAVDPRQLTPPRAVDRAHAVHLLKNLIFDHEELRLWERSPEAPQVLGHAIFQVLSRNYAPLGQRMRSIMKRLERMPKYIDQSRERLRAPSKMFVEIELETITRLPGFFNILKDIGRDHMPATPQRDLNRLIEQAQNALERYSDWLIVDILPDCREDYAIGEEKVRRLLAVRGIDASPGQLASMAENELARLRERQRETAREIRRKVSLEDTRDTIKQQHPENFDGVLRFVRDAVQKARQFVGRSKFTTLPEGEQIYVIETPSFLRHFLPFGGYWPPAPFENKHDGYFFVTPGDCDSDKLREHNYPALTNMTLREGYPGRHLQTSWAVRRATPLRMFHEDPAATFGWGAYCEERAKEMGYDDTPPSRFMQGQSAVFSAVRVLIDLKLSTGKMSYQEAIETLIDHLGMDRICAEAEARRYVTSPGAQLAPLWGREQIKRMRKWTKDRLGDRFSDAFFHTAFLQAGLIPLHLVRREIELKVAEELSKPVEKPKEEAARADKKHPAPAARKPLKAAPKKPAAKKHPRPASRKRSKPRPRPRRRKR